MEIKLLLLPVFAVMSWGLFGCCDGQPKDEPFIISDFKNMTVNAGTVVKLPCVTSGFPKPTVTWTYNNVTVTSDRRGNRRRITTTGTLKLRTVKVADEGWYTCAAVNIYGRAVSPSIFVKVEAPAKIVEGPNSTITAWGSRVTLRCRVKGRPTPHLEWRKDGIAIPDPVSGKLYSLPELVVNVTDNATYMCKTQNILSHGVAQAEASAIVTYYEHTRPLGHCSSVIAPICRDHLHVSDDPVFHSLDHSTEDTSAILNYLFENVISAYDPVCRRAVQRFLCRSAFPVCQIDQDHYLHRPISLCRESCIQVTNVLCPDIDWEDLKYHTETHRELQAASGNTPVFESYKWSHLSPDYCDSLPVSENLVHNTNTSHHGNKDLSQDVNKPDKEPSSQEKSEKTPGVKNSKVPLKTEEEQEQQCTHIAFDFVDGQLSKDMCYIDNGQTYRGRVNITETGKKCVLWSDHPVKDRFILDVEQADNYCRNPEGLKERPWCLVDSTASQSQQWEYCPLLKCSSKENKVTINRSNSKEDTSEDVMFTWGFISILTACVAICLGILVAIIQCGCRRRSNFHNGFHDYLKPMKQDQMLQSFSIDITKMSKNGFYHQRLSSVSSYGKLERMEFPRNEITYLEDIAEGAFGKVFKARARCFVRGNFEDQFVAVKSLRENCKSSLEEELLKEADFMVELEHPNIIKLLGVCLQEAPMCLLYEYMNEGDLQGFLQRRAPPQFPVKKKPQEEGKNSYLTTSDLLDIAKQICSGIMYLAKKGFVHRDLATRNCLITDNLVVKISDFALIQSTELYKNDFRGKESDSIAIRWMPLEAVLLNEFTIHSDVWSFGMVLWEVFSYAQQPYYGLSNEEVIDFLKQGRILPPPEDNPKEVYAIMKQCWNYTPQKRPTFDALYSALSRCKQELLSDKSQLTV